MPIRLLSVPLLYVDVFMHRLPAIVGEATRRRTERSAAAGGDNRIKRRQRKTRMITASDAVGQNGWDARANAVPATFSMHLFDSILPVVAAGSMRQLIRDDAAEKWFLGAVDIRNGRDRSAVRSVLRGEFGLS
jgi:hypothetical protein